MEKMVVVQHENEEQVLRTAESRLEQLLIEKYLAHKGYRLADWERVPPEQAKRLITEACQYAALKLTEIESTAHLWAEVEGQR